MTTHYKKSKNGRMFIGLCDPTEVHEQFWVGSSPEDLAKYVEQEGEEEAFDGIEIYEVVKTGYKLKKNGMSVVASAEKKKGK